MAEIERRTTMGLVVVAALFVTTLITANIIAVKLIAAGPWLLPAAIVIFPVSYIIGDVLTEVYGYRRARQVIWLGFVCNLLTVVAIWAGQVLPGAPVWDAQGAYERILGFTPRLLAASFMAYLAGEFANAYVLARLKVATEGRWLWLRTISSTVVGQGLDSAIFLSMAFGGLLPLPVLAELVVTQWLAKVLYEALATPLTYLTVGYLKRVEGLDAYDRGVAFNPLRVLG